MKALPLLAALAVSLVPAAAVAEDQFKLLVIAAPSTYHYEYIPVARENLERLGRLHGFAVTWTSDGAAFDVALDGLAGRVDVVHWHVDLDVYDPAIAPANGYAAPGGLSAGDVLDLFERTAAQLPVVSATLASYDPSYDGAGRLRDTALDLREAVAARATPVTRAP